MLLTTQLLLFTLMSMNRPPIVARARNGRFLIGDIRKGMDVTGYSTRAMAECLDISVFQLRKILKGADSEVFHCPPENWGFLQYHVWMVEEGLSRGDLGLQNRLNEIWDERRGISRKKFDSWFIFRLGAQE
jgi:hypothetical protein